MKDVEHHDVFGFPIPNLQKLGGMQLGPTSGTPLSFLNLNQKNKKCVDSRNLCNRYSCVKTLMLIRSKMSTKSIQFKSSYVIIVQGVRISNCMLCASFSKYALTY
jgi:hypothetical protein